MTDLTSASVPAAGPDDHARGEGPEVIAYFDLGCPHCAVTWVELGRLRLRLVFRHFPVSGKHPRAPALHAAAEAAAAQGGDEAFWDMCDSLYRDRGHVDDPHLWQRAERLGVDVARFERDRRSEPVSARVRRDFQSGIRAGVAGTPSFFVAGEPVAEDAIGALAGRAG